jgi:hypothetical protein
MTLRDLIATMPASERFGALVLGPLLFVLAIFAVAAVS